MQRAPDRRRPYVHTRGGVGNEAFLVARMRETWLATGSNTAAIVNGLAGTGPLVMVGHSLGGLYVRDYAARYPQRVAGMVLLDATPPTAFTALPDYPARRTVRQQHPPGRTAAGRSDRSADPTSPKY